MVEGRSACDFLDKEMKKLVLFAVLAAGCLTDPVSNSSTSNSDVPVSLLFEHDGCRVYRFVDGGHALYYVRCANSAGTIELRNCGKNCLKQDTAPVLP